MVNSENREDRFDATCGAKQMTRHRFRGTESQLVSVFAEGLLDRECLTFIAKRS